MVFSGIAGGMSGILGNSLQSTVYNSSRQRYRSEKEQLRIDLAKANKEIEELKDFIANELKPLVDTLDKQEE